MLQTERYTGHKLSADARPKIQYEYFVTGTGPFPADMLRYDAAWPADSESAAKMGAGFWDPEGAYQKRRSIKLYSYRMPTTARWQSFSWWVGRENLEAKEIA